MALNRRTFFIWLISFGVLVGVYIVYTHVNKTPEIKIQTPEGEIPDVNGLEQGGGTIGNTSPGPVEEMSFFEWVDEEKTIGREFGFAKLLHKEGEEWEIEKPFMNVYMPDGTCKMTANTGVVGVADEGGSISLKEALMTGDVVVRVTPKAGSQMKETVALLDDMQFISDKSLFSTAGPVRVENEDFKMSGRGLEFFYNMQINRLELLTLSSVDGIYARLERRGDSLGFGGGSGATDSGDGEAGLGSQLGEGGRDDMYRCILKKNVTIETGTEYVLTDELVIENVLLKSEDVERGAADAKASKMEAAMAEDVEKGVQEFQEVAINCRGGIVIEPMSAARAGSNAAENGSRSSLSSAQAAEAGGEDVTQVIAGQIKYDVVTEDSEARGAVKVVYYASTDEDANNDGRKVPVTITADKAELSRAEEVIVFDGNCVCSAPMPDSNDGQPWVLQTPRLTIDTSSSREGEAPRISALGALEFNFRSSSVTAEGANVPVKITARDYAEFSPSLNEVVFEGQCVCAMGGVEGDDAYSLSAPKVTVALASRMEEYPEAWAAGPSEVQFFTRDMMGAGGVEEGLPVTITAARGAWFTPLLNRIVFEGNCEFSMEDSRGGKKQTLTSPKFTVNLPDKEAGGRDEERLADRVRSLRAEGPLEVNFYVEDFIDANSGKALPAKITAKGQGRFIPELDKVTLEGDCVGVVTREVEGVREEYRFSAPVLNIDLQRDKDKVKAMGLAANIKHINAGGGGTVRLSVVRREGEKMLGGMELQCVRFDYDTGIEAFMAVGPGMIQVDNSGIEPEEGAGRFGLRKQCYALIENFETLDYFARSGRVVAASKSGDVNFGYIPLVNGVLGERVVGSARSVEVNLGESSEGRLEVASLLATGGITCTKGEDIAFSGKELSYKSESSMVSVRGGVGMPCFFNGGAVEGIQWNVKTDEFKFRIPGPGMF